MNGNHVEQHEEEDHVEEDKKPAPTAPPAVAATEPDDVDDEQPLSPTLQANGSNLHSISSAVALGLARSRSQGALSPSPPPDTSARLDALAQERDSLRQEVTELRKSLEDIQGKHEQEIGSLREELEEASEGKDHFETQYRNLLGRVNTIKSSLGDRLKADAVSATHPNYHGHIHVQNLRIELTAWQARLEEAHSQIAQLEDQNRELQENNTSLTEELAKLREEQEQHVSEIANLRKQASLSQQNWIAERDDLIAREAYAKEEFENARAAMNDWEALALNERSLHHNLKEKMAEIEEEIETLREAHARAVNERDQNSEAVDGLQKALQRLQAGKHNTTHAGCT